MKSTGIVRRVDELGRIVLPKELRDTLYIAAPEPTDEELSLPEPMVTVTWPTGYVTMTLAAYNKLPAKTKTQFNKLGGLS